ncbi:hypothetical protein BJF92_07050 [Rhizobium rhizosphaerae]|uniref:Uncharacterized protein n=1 Tax=Xaviernesmea rhizosphaerae TaxID=1672749 RepID=A0A1Q9AD12_9HYPH|nr:hypothetical protein [Xaviernesmea rhizosphaerae]OLP52764.1 hypothetical protein BJF92_07050 [Xaviernesmea rhizosphaerae]
MTLTLTLTGPGAAHAAETAADLLATLTGERPQTPSSTGPDDIRRDLATGLAIAGIVLSVPGAVLATLDLSARLRKRRELAPKVEAVKRVLEAADAQGTIRIEETTISLTGLGTDQILDRLLAEKPH